MGVADWLSPQGPDGESWCKSEVGVSCGFGVCGGCSGFRSTVQLKGLEEELKGQECLATVKTIMLHSCSLRYPFWFSEMNLETDLLVDVVSVRGSSIWKFCWDVWGQELRRWWVQWVQKYSAVKGAGGGVEGAGGSGNSKNYYAPFLLPEIPILVL